MLSDNERAVILEQEIFRKAIREELSPPEPKSKKERAWEILNSNFGMWLLSAVLISGLGTLYTRHQTTIDEARRSAEAERAESRRLSELRDRLRLEISFRLSSALSRLNEIDKTQNRSAVEDRRKSIQRALAPLAFPASDSAPPLFPEFKAFSGIALIAELRRHVPDGEKRVLKKILANTAGSVAEAYSEQAIGERTASEVGALLLKRMRDPAWDNGFPFTDCPDQNPFC